MKAHANILHRIIALTFNAVAKRAESVDKARNVHYLFFCDVSRGCASNPSGRGKLAISRQTNPSIYRSPALLKPQP